MKNKNQFKTTQFYLTAFLLAKGLILADIDKTSDPKRYQFIFIDSPQLKKLVEVFNFSENNASEALVNPRLFAGAIKSLKEKIYQY